MSPDQGRRRSPGKGGTGKGNSRAAAPIAARRRGLLFFGAVFVALFAVVAISEGIGHPSVPDGAVAYIEDAPGDLGTITQEQFDRSFAQVAAQSGQKKPPKPGDPQYDELKESALNAIFESVWLQGLAAEMGISVSDKQVENEFKKVKKESFQSEAEYKKFLKDAKYTQADVNERVKLQKLSSEIQAQLSEEVPQPTSREIQNYYEAGKSTQFTQPASRDIRSIVNKDRAKAKQARLALGKDNTAANWKKVAKKYSEDAATKNNGGEQKGVTEAALEEPLSEAVFNAPEGQVDGPIDAQRGFTVFEVTKSTPESVQALKDVEAQIQGALSQRAEQEFFNAFVGNYNTRWAARTFCADDYLTQRCANFRGDGRQPGAQPGCYEADPDGGRPEACPAPVFQLVPAMPGTITPLEPRGRPLAQRPQPVPSDDEGGAPTGAPGGALPPGAAPGE